MAKRFDRVDPTPARFHILPSSQLDRQCTDQAVSCCSTLPRPTYPLPPPHVPTLPRCPASPLSPSSCALPPSGTKSARASSERAPHGSHPSKKKEKHLGHLVKGEGTNFIRTDGRHVQDGKTAGHESSEWQAEAQERYAEREAISKFKAEAQERLDIRNLEQTTRKFDWYHEKRARQQSTVLPAQERAKAQQRLSAVTGSASRGKGLVYHN